MGNVLVEVLPTSTGESARTTPGWKGAATETVNARLEQVGCFRDDSVGANQSASAMSFQDAVATSPTAYLPGVPGTIIGVAAFAESSTTHGPISAGSMTFQPTIGGVAVGSPAVLSHGEDSASVIFATPVSFNALDLLGITLASASLSPTTSYGRAWLLIRHSGVAPASAAGPVSPA